MTNTMIHVDYNEILMLSEAYFRKMCGFSTENQEALEIRRRFENQLIPKVLLSVLPSDCIKDGGFQFGDSRVDFDAMRNIKNEQVKAVIVYGMCVDELNGKEELDMLEQFYLDTWMTAMLDAGRDWVKSYLQDFFVKKANQKIWVTDSFGPGYYGMGMEQIPAIMRLIEAEKIGMKLYHGTMYPPKSNVGFYLILDAEVSMLQRDCKSCLANHKNCIFCKNYTFCINQFLEK